jgi:fluoride exporter
LNALALGLIAIALGSVIGGWARWGLSLWLNARFVLFPLGTFVANAVGGFLVGLAVAFFVKHPELSPAWRLFAVTGFLGGLTTFSTYSAEVVGLIERGEVMWALGLAAAHLFASLLLTAAGIWIYRAMAA